METLRKSIIEQVRLDEKASYDDVVWIILNRRMIGIWRGLNKLSLLFSIFVRCLITILQHLSRQRPRIAHHDRSLAKINCLILKCNVQSIWKRMVHGILVTQKYQNIVGIFKTCLMLLYFTCITVIQNVSWREITNNNNNLRLRIKFLRSPV